MGIVIQKFGGSSLSTKEGRHHVIEKIITAKEQGQNPVVVVSAIGRKGDPYATDTLLEITNAIYPNLALREKDLLMSCGEIISAVVLVSSLYKQGYTAMALTGGQAGIITDENFGQATVQEMDTIAIRKALAAGIIPVVAGFQGQSQKGDITTLGRGGSDTTAALLGESIGAQAIEIYTDVDGMMTTDPRIYPQAQMIENLSYHEVFQMADSGARVIHPRAVEIARRSGIPLYIKNTFKSTQGTCISHNTFGSTDSKDPGARLPLVTAIAHRPNQVQFCIEDKELQEEKFFTLLAAQGVSIDMINFFPNRKIFIIDSQCISQVLELLETQSIKYCYIQDCCKITMIGEGMTGIPGVMAKIIRCLKKEEIEILQTADSLTTIACLIYHKDLCKAVTALHKEFEL
ncbi:MAG: aspartate kinase [Epulopiscium sp.]|nr:aspartate kinase [Candidatus Epulonipiscium sp.]